jgi:hypothetical protein
VGGQGQKRGGGVGLKQGGGGGNRRGNCTRALLIDRCEGKRREGVKTRGRSKIKKRNVNV